MGKTITPKYVVDVYTRLPDGRTDKTTMIWDTKRHGRSNASNVEKYALAYGKSLEKGEVNAHISEALGYIPYPHKVVLRYNVQDGCAVAQWVAPMFMVW